VEELIDVLSIRSVMSVISHFNNQILLMEIVAINFRNSFIENSKFNPLL